MARAISVMTAEAEEVGNFASDSFAHPLLQEGTILWTLGYLIWVQPEVAGLATLVYLPQLLLVPRLQGAINRLSRRRTVLQRTIGKNIIEMGRLEQLTAPLAAPTCADFGKPNLSYPNPYLQTQICSEFSEQLPPLIGPCPCACCWGILVIRGQTEVSTLVVFMSGFNRISDPWADIVAFYRSLSHAHVAYDLVRSALLDRR